MGYQWHFEVVGESLAFLLGGLGLTVGLSVLSMALSLVLGLLVSFARLAPWRLLRAIGSLYTDFLRGTPLLVQILWIYYSLPILTGVVFSPFVSATIALTLNLSAFISEIYRAGIQSNRPRPARGSTCAWHVAVAGNAARHSAAINPAGAASPWQRLGEPVQRHRDRFGDRGVGADVSGQGALD